MPKPRCFRSSGDEDCRAAVSSLKVGYALEMQVEEGAVKQEWILQCNAGELKKWDVLSVDKNCL